MFNNNVFGSLLKAMRINLFNEENEEVSLPPPPPSNDFLLNNDGEILFDNPTTPLLVD